MVLPDIKDPNTLVIIMLVTVTLYFLKKYFNGGVCTITDVNLSGKTAVVTGGNGGIGTQTVKFLTKKGCAVVIGARNKANAENIIKQCRKDNPSACVEFIELDLSSKESISDFAKNVPFENIDYLVNNAGVMAIPQRKTTKEGLQRQMGTNHIGHFYLTYLLWNKIVKSTAFRVINVSSIAHKGHWPFFMKPKLNFDNMNLQTGYEARLAYALSKLYNLLFTHALAEKINPKQGKVLSLHPGVVRTELQNEFRSQGIGKFIKYATMPLLPLFFFLTKSPWQGCQTTLHTLLSNQVENGCYYSDCQKDQEHEEVTKQNWQILWKKSQDILGIKFNI